MRLPESEPEVLVLPGSKTSSLFLCPSGGVLYSVVNSLANSFPYFSDTLFKCTFKMSLSVVIMYFGLSIVVHLM